MGVRNERPRVHGYLWGEFVQQNKRQINLDETVSDLQDSFDTLNRYAYENLVLTKINSILGPDFRRGRDARDEINDHLDDAEEAGAISVTQNDDVNIAYLLWQGITKQSRKTIYIIGEAPCFTEFHDVQRAIQRAQTVQRAGLRALSLVAGRKWTREAIEVADKYGIVRV